MTTLVGFIVIVAAIVAVVRKVDVRLALTVAALLLGIIAGQPQLVVAEFLRALTKESFVLPLTTAMGFAYVVRLSGCDQHLVRLLVKPVRKVRFLLVPATVLIGFAVNIPIVSQTSTAVTVGTVLLPLLRAAGIGPITAGAALLLGASIGGELLNPGSPELRTVSEKLSVESTEVVKLVVPLVLPHLLVATGLFWLMSRWWTDPQWPDDPNKPPEDFRVNVVKALVPLLPLAILFLTASRTALLPVPDEWLLGPKEPRELKDPRLVGAAMLIGAAAAALAAGRNAGKAATAFFEGAGYSFAHVVSLIVAAVSFGKGIELIGLQQYLHLLIDAQQGLLIPLAVFVPLAFAVASGSGIAATQSLFAFFIEPAHAQQVNPMGVGALVSLGAASGRTMSPLAASCLVSASMTGSSPGALSRRVALPLFGGLFVVLLLRLLWPG